MDHPFVGFLQARSLSLHIPYGHPMTSLYYSYAMATLPCGGACSHATETAEPPSPEFLRRASPANVSKPCQASHGSEPAASLTTKAGPLSPYCHRFVT